MANANDQVPSQLPWLVTGCSSGLGRRFIPSILERGDNIIATARNVDTLSDFADHGNVRLLQLDVSSPEAELGSKVAQALLFFGRIDVLVNNAGYVLSGAWEEIQ